MKTFIAALLLSTVSAYAQAPPEPPQGAGSAEWKFQHVIAIETPILRDARYLQQCGLRSSGWVTKVIVDMKIASDGLLRELALSLPRDWDDHLSRRFVTYGNSLITWLLTPRPMPPVDRESCEAALNRINAWEAELVKWSYR